MKAAIDGLGNLGYSNIILWVLEENTTHELSMKALVLCLAIEQKRTTSGESI